ncbi:MAG: hypothetical protein CO108_27565 [Deltaproteobacteria bacterium CG_4_9_14_3_um_filter_63_12]|nr:MAG: hypothetical protein COW42_09290 [Deltaproteobacteria bacterium CG17_big_fil_post_rev_8_21_14_2_50_63_7]PJB34726.1 MAG: hypothetical protein CO108_27565 [Deltaproteobacteria bacterium CG_4_9_14_3_um_filter_63_12]
MSVIIPDKTYFKIGEVSKLIEVKPYILRYWESEFRVLRPQKSRSKHRLYRRRDVEVLLQIKCLLYDEKYTIAGAKRRIRELMESKEFVPGRSSLVVTESETDGHVGDNSFVDELEDDAEEDSDDEELDEESTLAAENSKLRRLLAEAQAALEVREAQSSRIDVPQPDERDSEELATLQVGITALETELETRGVELNSALGELADIRAALGALTVERDGLVATRERLRNKLLERKDREDRLRSVLGDRTTSVHNLEEELGRLREALATSSVEASEARQDAEECERLTLEVRTLSAQGGEAAAKNADLERQVVASEQRISELERAAADQSVQREAQELQHASKLQELQEEFERERDRRAALEQELEAMRAFAKESSEFEVMVERLNDQNSSLEQRLANHRRAREALSRSIRLELVELSGVTRAF